MNEDPATFSSIRGHASGVADNANALMAESRQLANDVCALVTVQMTAHPYRTMLVAAGVGYVLGGGLVTALTGRLVGAGLRLAVLPGLQRELRGLGMTGT